MTSIFRKLALAALPMALGSVAAVAGPLDFTSITQVTDNTCTAATQSSCVHVSSAAVVGGTIKITVDLAHLYGSDYDAFTTLSFTSAHGSILGDTVFGCNIFGDTGTTCQQGGNYFDGRAWGGTPGTGTVKVISDTGDPEFFHGGAPLQTTGFTGTDLTIAWGFTHDDYPNKTLTYDYQSPFVYEFTIQQLSDAPEPGSVMLLGSGLLGLGMMIRRRRA